MFPGTTLLVQEANNNDLSAATLLWFGGAAMAFVGIIQAIRIIKGGQFSASFVKLYGLILVVSFGMVLVVSTVTDQAKAPGFTLLGIVAGYLAGARATTALGGGGDETL